MASTRRGESNRHSSPDSMLILFSNAWIYTVTLPNSLKASGDVTLEFNTIQSNAGTPLPASVSQSDPQSLEYSVDLFVISPYTTTVQRTRVRYVIDIKDVYHVFI